jgi:hypothetical protein
MEKAFKFRVLIDTAEKQDVFRDIELKNNNSFLDLHNQIQEAFGFDNSEMASFYLSNEDWERGEEIALMDMGAGKQGPSRLMEDTAIHDIVEDQKQKILYVFDFLRMWTFFVEVAEIRDAEKDEEFPKISLSYGEAPDQNSKTAEDLFGTMNAYPDDDDSEKSDFDEPFEEEL